MEKTLKELLEKTYNTMNDISVSLVKDNCCQDIEYLSDLFTEVADNNVSVYYSEQRDYYYDNMERCEYSFKDLGYELKDFDSIDDALCRAGVCGMFDENYSQLVDDEEEIKTALLLNNLIELNPSKEQEELLIDNLDLIYDKFISNDRVDYIDSLEFLKEYFDAIDDEFDDEEELDEE